ncbi:hypothetical protein [Marilutibacter aestuarii]|nr:hypothetical protein [Lysobacter aestuarii]
MNSAKHIDHARALRPQGPGMHAFMHALAGSLVEAPRDTLDLHD